MKILAIETSCDETAIAILEEKGGSFRLLSNVVSSQVEIHAKWGGVVPSLAKREHVRNLPTVLKKSLKEAGFKIPNSIPDIDLIAVVNGPGLEPALWTGINFANELAKKWNKPLLPINHLEGHLFSVFLEDRKNFQFSISNFQFPTVALLVSGGHTELVLVKNWLKYEILGRTRDDAAGEAFDKVAKMLNLGYPGGPAIAKLASQWNSKFLISNSPNKIDFPRPMINTKDFDFSFSGLKTAVLYKIKELGKITPKIKKEICYEFQEAVIDVLVSKTIRAAKEYNAKSVILAGGVSANEELRNQLSYKLQATSYKLNFLAPAKKFCGDNAAMIALAAYFRWQQNKTCSTFGASHVKADGNLKIT